MKSLMAVVLLFGFLTVAARAQQDADEKYMGIYGFIQQGDSYSANGQQQSALDNYEQALSQLNGLHNSYPDWNPRIVIFRQKYLAERINDLKSQLPPPAPVAPASPVVVTPPNSAAAVATTTQSPAAAVNNAPADWADQLAALRSQLQNAQSDNATLGAKLKEALAVQPATLDPRELTAAKEQIRDLMKQNDLLKSSLEQQKLNTENNPRYQQLKKLTKELKAANERLADEQKHQARVASENDAQLQKLMASDKALAALRDENAVLHGQLTDATNTETSLQASLAAAHAEAATLHTELQARTDETKKLQAQIKAATKSDHPVEKLKTELAAAQAQADGLRSDLQAKTEEAESLQKQVKAESKTDHSLDKLKQQLADARAEAKAAEADKAALEERLRELQSAAPAGNTAASSDNDARLRDLTRERDELLAQLGEANRKLLSRKTGKEESTAEIARLNSDLAAARDQLSALTLTPVPYTAAELALFEAPAAPVHQTPATQFPAGTEHLVASAQKHFAAQELDQANDDYVQILQHDTNNAITLGNLAAIEIDQGHYENAEAHLRSALAQSPNDSYSLTQLGNVLFHEKKYNDAVTALSQAVRLDANSPDAYNYLGVTLSFMGLRAQAETALRKAVQINPAFAPAHLNLANVYLNQQPPSPQLARWHYQKALDAGEPHNAGIEKELASLGAPINP